MCVSNISQTGRALLRDIHLFSRCKGQHANGTRCIGFGSECILGAKIVGVAIDIGSGDDLPILNDETGRGDGDLLACLEDFSRTKDLDFGNCQVVGS